MDGVTIALMAGLAAVALIAIVLTITARRTAKRARDETLRAAVLKNDFVSMVSHELRTPLTSIYGFSSMLMQSWRDLPPEELDEFLSIITFQSQHLQDLVEDILTIPRLDAGRIRLHRETFDLAELTHEVANVIFPAAGSPQIAIEIPGGVNVFADVKRVGQILRNLLDNARKYGGDQVLVEGAMVGEDYMVIVSDNGPGVGPEEREVIFRHFEQLSKGDARSNQGIGLGLPIARQLARAMGGDLWYEARFPTGSRFCFTMNIRPDQDMSAEVAYSQEAQTHHLANPPN